ncbi:alkaline phosphatase family protein [Mycolicibacterium xanthum]|uniref:alkaline phosphatase family protein n=1 Tax=Mycolicibacterium xanthum TaxID=2796469 RepID=UPI0027DF8B1C|nr:alkaline phosphatase family protein [Mycolicibacterium xanthum]
MDTRDSAASGPTGADSAQKASTEDDDEDDVDLDTASAIAKDEAAVTADDEESDPEAESDAEIAGATADGVESTAVAVADPATPDSDAGSAASDPEVADSEDTTPTVVVALETTPDLLGPDSQEYEATGSEERPDPIEAEPASESTIADVDSVDPVDARPLGDVADTLSAAPEVPRPTAVAYVSVEPTGNGASQAVAVVDDPVPPTAIRALLRTLGISPVAGTGSPVTPVNSPLLFTMLAWVRREFEQTFPGPTAQQLGALIVGPQDTVAATAALVQSPNLLVNPGAEVGDPSLSGYSSVTVPGWTVTGTPTVIEYGTLRRLPWPLGSPGPTLPAFLGFPSTRCAPPDSGEQFFGGGNVATSTLTQTVDLSAAASDIDTGAVPYTLSGWLGGFTLDPSAASVTVTFLDENQLYLGTGRLTPVTVLDRWLQTGLLERETTGTIPVGTRSAQVVVTFTDCNPAPGNYNNAYADNLSFTVGADLPAPPPPAPPVSTVGQLDHVFMVYLENKGFTDIVGSPNAPYLNSIINAYGFGSNYYALTHPSLPNYYPILGGSDFGINYNCPANCVDEPNLADSIEAAGLTWAGYAQSGGGYAVADNLPFLGFSDIYNDPARVEAHLFDLTQLAGDLDVPADAPNFVWFAADDATNMEGPTNTLVGIVQWAISQLTPPLLGGHQYNVAAGDKWLQDTLPMILSSPTWQDPTQRSVIVITFDEDYNNLSLGIGNQGNHITTVVIPSPGAVNAGMRDGHFVADDHNNHYSLLRTIEEALGLPPLTNNDRYAQPMNEYWV